MNTDNKTFFEQNIERGIEKGILRYSEDGKKIIYLKLGKNKEDKKYSIGDPEEKVRASYFTELILDYGYSKNRIALELVVPKRTPKDLADIVVFEDDENKNPYIVVECKKDGISEAEFKQAVEQVFGNANAIKSDMAIVVAGTTKEAFNVKDYKPLERIENIIADIPKINKEVPKYSFIKKENDLKIVSRGDLIKALEKSHDTIWQGGKLAPTTAFDEVSKLLFCKIKDEKGTKNNEIYKFQIGTGEKPKDVFERINKIYEEARKEDEEVFKEDIKLSPEVVFAVVRNIQGINFNGTDLDSKGVAFERFMEDFFKGKMGQYFTPREIIDFCVEMIDLKNTDKVLDTSCGSGGFLLSALNKIRNEAESDYDSVEANNTWHKFAENNLYGIEINEQIARVCKMNMIVHDDGHTNVISTDGLDRFEQIAKINQRFGKEQFSKILTNPPFGAMVKGAEKEENYLDRFDLGKNKTNQKTEILFIERCFDFLKPGGKMAIVLPDIILTNSTLQYVRDFIMKKFKIEAIVSIPQFSFSHFGAGVKASLMFLKKKRSEDEKLDHYPIFMAIAKRIGYDAAGRKDNTNDFVEILKEYKKFKKK